MDLFGVDILKILTIDLVHVLTIGIIGGILLRFATGYLYFQNRSFNKIVAVMVLGCSLFFILDFIPVFGFVLGQIGFWFLIKYFYNETWILSIAAWSMSIFIAFMISLLILLLLGIDIIFMPNLL